MKQTVIITAEELRDAALAVLMTKQAFNGKYVAGVEFVFDKTEPSVSRQIRAEVVLFDTQKAAIEYFKTGAEIPESTAPQAEPEQGDTTANLEGTTKP